MAELFAPLSRRGRRWLVALSMLTMVFGLVVEKRSAFMQRRMTDLGVYLRAAWAVRAGEDIYDVVDNNRWHYQYPPLFAMVLAPLADPPAGADHTGYIAYPWAVAFWYVFSVCCLAWGVHALASALEKRAAAQLGGAPPVGCRRWWLLRITPILVCITPIGHTLMRGQVNLLLLALLCGMAASFVRGHPVRSGVWLAAAICLKVIPAFLLVFPLWRRNVRCLASCAAGITIGLVAIPAAVFGLPRTVAYYQEYKEKLLGPAVGQGNDQSRAEELIMMTRNDSQSILAALHNSLYLDRLKRPPHPSDSVRRLALGIVGAMTLVTLLAAGLRKRAPSASAEVLFLGALVLVMLLSSPVCHLHYFCLLVPLVLGLLDVLWRGERNPRVGKWLILFALANIVADTLPNLPDMELVRDLGLAMYASVAIWAIGCFVLWKETGDKATETQTVVQPINAAA